MHQHHRLRKRIKHQQAILLAALTGVLGGCGGQSHSILVARVGSTAITAPAVEHWISVLAGGRTSARQKQALSRRALQVLISDAWLIEGARQRGATITAAAVRGQLTSKRSAQLAGGEGEAEANEFLKATGQDTAGLELEARAELAAAALRHSALTAVPRVTDAQIHSYYQRHTQQFVVPERRELQITNRKSSAAAESVRREAEAGRRFDSLSLPESMLISRTNKQYRPASHLEEVEAGAKLHTLIGPVRRRVDYFILEVVQIIPAHPLTLAQVRSSIEQKLQHERSTRALAAAVAAWRSQWTAKTDCAPGYVVQKCAHYTGPRAAEAALTFN
jgi:PPIC-type PPIASE domain